MSDLPVPSWSLRENPGPPDRPERGDRWPGGPGFYLGLGLLLAALLLDRFLGPLGMLVLWGSALAVLWFFRRPKP